MKLLFYSPVKLTSGGGCERWHCDITTSLQNQFGYEVKIVTANLGTPQWSGQYLQSQLHVPYEIINYPIFMGALIPTPSAFLKLFRLFRRADIIHVIHGFIGQDLLVLILKLLTGKKIVLGWHSPIFHSVRTHNIYMKFISRPLLNFFDAHMTLNASDKKFLEQKWGVKNVQFIPSGIRLERFLSLPRLPHKTLNFITVGIYRPQKGIDLALEAIYRFNQKFPENKALFRFVGAGELKPLVSQYSNNHPNIIDAGYVSNDSIPTLYQASDIYLLSSREEPFGLVLIEAWSSGIPALATRTEGPLDMLSAGRNGWFINSTDANAIFTGICNLYSRWLHDPKFLAALEKNCRQTGKKYGIDVTARRMRKSYFAYA